MRINRVVGFLFLFALCSLQLNAQKSFLDEADHKLYKEEKYFEAIEMYKKAYIKEKVREKKAEIIFKIGEAYRLSDQSEQAEVWYDKSIIAQYNDPIAHLRLAEVKMQGGKYDEALVQYQKYAAKIPEDNRGKLGIESAEKAQRWADNPDTYVVEPVVLINSEFYDYAPTFSDKKNMELVFTSTREGSVGSDMSEVTGDNFSDLYRSQRDKKGKWSEPVLADNDKEGVNSEASEGAATFNARRNMMYFTRCGVTKNEIVECAIYSAKKQGLTYGKPELIAIAGDSATVGHPALTPDDKVLIFSSNLTGGQGGKDLWYIKEESRGKWSAPINLGPGINTDGDEMFPYIRNNGDLYFASNGHGGMGGLDIFVAPKKGDAQWGKVANLKAPINSAGNDFSIIFDGDADRGYFTSSRPGGRGKDDIWEFKRPPVLFVLKGIVKDEETGEPLSAATVQLIGTDGTTAEKETRADGTFEFADKGNGESYINKNTSYSLTVSKPDYLNAKGKETTVGIEESKIFAHLYELIPIKVDGIKLPEILYDFNKTTLTDQAKDSLDYLYGILIDNPTIVIQLRANTDSRGSDSYNENLSQGRAESVVEYLTSRGIPAERMEPKGYGETNLLISDAEIAKLPTEEEREAAHQLNRRTDFIVLSNDYVPKPTQPELPDMEEGSDSEEQSEEAPEGDSEEQ